MIFFFLYQLVESQFETCKIYSHGFKHDPVWVISNYTDITLILKRCLSLWSLNFMFVWTFIFFFCVCHETGCKEDYDQLSVTSPVHYIHGPLEIQLVLTHWFIGFGKISSLFHSLLDFYDQELVYSHMFMSSNYSD